MRRLAATVAILVAVSVLSTQLAGGVRTPQQAAAGSEPPEPAPITAPVERRALRERITLRGTVRAPAERAFGVRSSLGSETLVVTANPLRTGSRVHEGQVAIEVSGRPLLVLEGPVPMYRDIHVGARGRDVLQLQAALARLGMAPGPVTGVATPQTLAAMLRLYRSRGYEPAAAVQAAGSGSDAPAAGTDAPAAGTDAPAAGGDTPAAGDAGAAGRRAARPPALIAPQSEVAFAASLPARLARAQRVGAEPTERTVALALGVPLVRADAAVDQREALRPGARVSIELASGRRVPARIASVRRLDASAESGMPSLRLLIRPRRPLPSRAVGQEVSVALTTAKVGGPRSRWLVVPLAAVFARADGSSSVVRLRPDGRRERVAVVAGRSVEGYVAVRPSSGTLEPGEQVIVGE